MKESEDSTVYVKYQRDAKLIIQSDFLPNQFRNGPPEKVIANVCILCSMAEQFKLTPIQLAEQMYLVKGRPAWRSSFVLSLLKTQGLKVTFEEIGDWDTDPDAKTRCIATDKNGEQYMSTWITKKLVQDEGWMKSSDSKWLTMPAQMARYRSATFLLRAYWPELLMGYYTTDEQEDINSDKSEKLIRLNPQSIEKAS
ncbi:MAG: recombinase RecT [Paludibacteraceae bacterium]|nr:recombinase RecT [Paludibacteraceae bacterium]